MNHNKPASGNHKEQLATIRTSIDEVDKQVLDLLSKRLDLAVSLRELKPENASAWAPDREHKLLQHLLAERPQNIAPELVVRIWSTLISTSLQAQGPLLILVPEPKMLPLAESAFPGAPARLFSNPCWIEEVANTKGAIALLPAPDTSNPDHSLQNWWLQLAKTGHGVSVQTALPKIADTILPVAYCASKSMPGNAPGQACWYVLEKSRAGSLELDADITLLAESENHMLVQVSADFAPSRLLQKNTKPPIAIGSFYPPTLQD